MTDELKTGAVSRSFDAPRTDTRTDTRSDELRPRTDARAVDPSFDAPRIDTSAVNTEPAPEVPTRRQRAKAFAVRKTPQSLKNPTDLQVRLRTGSIYIAITLIGILAGNIPCVVMLSLTAAITAGEFYYMLRSDAKLPNEALGIIAAILYPIAMFMLGLAGAMVVSFLLMLALIVWYVFWQRARITDVCVSFFGAAYTGLLLGSIMLIRPALEAPWGGLLVLLIFASVWINDGAAYLVGSRIGKHKMAPRISPKKSWEGFFAGIIASMATWCLAVLIPGVEMSVPLALLIGFACGIMGVFGDLAESRIKRNSGFKDSGTIMPGHGGLLDRTDSMFLAAVTAAILLIIFKCIPYVF